MSAGSAMERRQGTNREKRACTAVGSNPAETNPLDSGVAASAGFANVIFPYSRPIASVFCAAGLQTSSSSEARITSGQNANVARVVRSCLEFIAVPGSMYWRDGPLLQSAACPAATSPDTPSTAAIGTTNSMALKRKRNVLEPTMLQPNPRNVITSFYKTRAEAVSLSGYATDHELIVVACDRGQGSEAKAFNVLPRWDIPRFIREIPDHKSRNLYCLVDESALVDPFLDVDVVPSALAANLETLASRVTTSWDDVQKELEIENTCDQGVFLEVLSQAVRWVKTASITTMAETLLRDVLIATYTALRDVLDTTVERGVVLTSSVPPLQAEVSRQSGHEKEPYNGKISFHLHFRLAHGAVFGNVRELHNFMQHLKRILFTHAVLRRRDELQVSRPVSSLSCAFSDIPNFRLLILVRAIDFAVYTRWRAFRLPYNCKAQGAQPCAFTEIIRSALVRAGISTQSYRVGDVANCVISPPWTNTETLALLQAALPRGIDLESVLRSFTQNQRYLVPVISGVTSIHNKELSALLPPLTISTQSTGDSTLNLRPSNGSLLQPHEVVSLFDMAFIQRDQVATVAGSKLRPLTMENVRTVVGGSSEQNSFLLCPRPVEGSPKRFAAPRPRDGLRRYINDPAVLESLAEVFRCLSHHYTANSESISSGSSAITGATVHAQFTEEVRSFYAQQKVSKYCLRQQRYHQSTYGQLFLTYGSIKFRCYSNDCHDRCRVICWSPGDVAKGLCSSDAVMPVDERGYPKYARLEQLRMILFPELSKEELLRRYGSSIPLL